MVSYIEFAVFVRHTMAIMHFDLYWMSIACLCVMSEKVNYAMKGYQNITKFTSVHDFKVKLLIIMIISFRLLSVIRLRGGHTDTNEQIMLSLIAR